jgi:hypothetical protein
MPAFAHDTCRTYPRIYERSQIGVIFRTDVFPACAPKGNYLRVLKLYLFYALEEFHVFWVRTSEAPLNIMDAEFIKLFYYLKLIGYRE